MFRGGACLTEAEQQAIREEISRIESDPQEFVLSYDAIAEIVLKVKAAGNEEHRNRQRVGIEAARSRGVTLGRPTKARPKNFPALVAAIEKGDLSRVAVAKTLGVSCETLRKWIKEYREEAEF